MIRIYRDPNTSAVVNDEEFTRLTDAICCDPTPGAEISENGVTYARAIVHPDATENVGWNILRAGAQRIVLEGAR